MLYSVLIAICLSTTPVEKCDRESAVDWIAGPQSDQKDGLFVGLAACQMTGMRYLAQTRLMDKNTYAKIYCQPPRVAARG